MAITSLLRYSNNYSRKKNTAPAPFAHCTHSNNLPGMLGFPAISIPKYRALTLTAPLSPKPIVTRAYTSNINRLHMAFPAGLDSFNIA